MIDFSSGFPATANERLKGQRVVWLTTVDPAGRPQPRPVWFHWDGVTFLVFSQENAAKVRHIASNPKVSVHLNSDPDGDEVTVFLGTAVLLPGWPAGPRLDEYLQKYEQGIAALGNTSESFMQEYNTPIEVTPAAIRGF